MTSSKSAVIFALVFLIPATLYVLVIVAYPLVDTVNLSFTNAGLPKSYHWVGWDNYVKIFNATFGTVIGRTFIWTFFSVSLKMIIGTAGAVLLNAAVPGRALFRVLTLPPWIIPMAIGIFMWGWMDNGQTYYTARDLTRLEDAGHTLKTRPAAGTAPAPDPSAKEPG